MADSIQKESKDKKIGFKQVDQGQKFKFIFLGMAKELFTLDGLQK